MYMIWYCRNDGSQIHIPENFNSLKDVFLDLASETVNLEIASACVIQVLNDGRRWNILQWDREGLHHCDVIGTIRVLGSEKFTGATKS